MSKFNKKVIAQKDITALWGDESPYSEVSLIEQTRILDDHISRVFLLVEAKINPFTFEYVLAHRDAFVSDSSIQDLLDHAEYRGQSEGYVVCAGEEEFIDKRSFELAVSYRKATVERIVKMHNFVIKEFGLTKFKNKPMGGIKVADLNDDKRKYVWDEAVGGVASVSDSLWSENSRVSSPAGEKNGKIRYFIILIIAQGVALNHKETTHFCRATKKVASELNVEVEGVDANRGYIMLTVLIGPEIAPINFIENCIKNSNMKGLLFLEDHFITNVSRPTWNQVEDFLRKFRK